MTLRVRVVRGKRELFRSRSKSVAILTRGDPRVPGGPGGSTLPPTDPTPPTPPPYLELTADTVELPRGSVAEVALPSPLRRIIELREAELAPGLDAFERSGVFVISAAAGRPVDASTATLTGVGCTDSDCGLVFRLTVPVEVKPIAAPATDLTGFTSPSPDRVAAGVPAGPPGAVDLRDQLTITLGTPDAVGSRTAAETIAAQVGGVISGGIPDIGVYEIRWAAPQDIAAVSSTLSSMPGVTGVGRVTPGLTSTDAIPPGDWDDDGPQAIWPFTQIRAQQAWDRTTGGNVPVGIVDGGTAYSEHEDLTVTDSFGGGAALHATHVAGLACARANGKGLVGVAWGCPLVSAGIGDRSAWAVLVAATRVALSGARVVNLSLGYSNGGYCHTQSEQDALSSRALRDKQAFRNLFQGPIGRGVLWTVSAGNNCATGIASPWGLNADLPNVISVAATNEDGALASFSNFGEGVEMAAPGGVSAGDVGIWSSLFDSCFAFFRCSTYGTRSGTSMSAPVVAGIAALVRSAHPGFGAAESATCIMQAAGADVGYVEAQSTAPASRRPVVPFDPAVHSLPRANAEQAVDCTTFDSDNVGSYIGSWVGGGWVLDMRQVSDGTLEATNQQPTLYPSGCYASPGLRVFTGLTLSAPGGQWNGGVAGSSDCQSFAYYDAAAMRAVRRSGGEVVIRLAWAQGGDGTRPVIDANGGVVSSSPYYTLDLARPSTTGATVTSQRTLRSRGPMTHEGGGAEPQPPAPGR